MLELEAEELELQGLALEPEAWELELELLLLLEPQAWELELEAWESELVVSEEALGQEVVELLLAVSPSSPQLPAQS